MDARNPDAMIFIKRLLVGDREPDEIINDNVDGIDVPYLMRWWVKDKGEHGDNIYLHCFVRSDYDRALHDHPRDSVSVILDGEYLEHTPEGTFHRKRGDVVTRVAASLHRIELISGPTWTLFIVGKKYREWGFACPDGWVHWSKFTEDRCK